MIKRFTADPKEKLTPYFARDEWPAGCFILDHGGGQFQAVLHDEEVTGRVASRDRCEQLINAKLKAEA